MGLSEEAGVGQEAAVPPRGETQRPGPTSGWRWRDAGGCEKRSGRVCDEGLLAAMRHEEGVAEAAGPWGSGFSSRAESSAFPWAKGKGTAAWDPSRASVSLGVK